MRHLRSTLLLVSAAALAACSDQGSPTAAVEQISAGIAPVRAAAPGTGVEGSYIVVLKEDANPRSVAALVGVDPRFVYTSALNGFAGELNAGQLNALRHNPAVEYIEEDQLGGIAATQSSAPWGLDRIDQTSNTLNGTYVYNTTASNVTAYVLDTGIATGHTQFGGRASNVWNYSGGIVADCHGHGTHVAGTIGASTYGVAKGVRLRGVRVVDCNGSGTTSYVIAGMDWVRLNHVKPAVANMSLGYPYSSSINTAVTNMINAGVFTAVASGNENRNACSVVSPASASAALTVNASDRYNSRASFSNYGSCTDIYAPGVSIISTWLNGTTNTISGTSMASPHAAGVGALYKGTYGDAASSTVHGWIVNNATTGVITNNPTGTPNRLLNKRGL